MRAPPDAAMNDVWKHAGPAGVESFLAGGERVLYCSHDLAALGDTAYGDASPLEPFDLGRSTGGSDATTAATDGIVWLGGGRPVTHAHYDTSHNVFVQVVGRKRFALWPPAALTSALRLYPTRHSLHRQSSLSHPTRLSAVALEVTLDEGEALYLPPFYAHHVTALSNLSISVAVWSASDEERRKDALETMPLPWEGDWPRQRVVLAAACYLRAALRIVHADDADAALRRLLESRYERLHRLPEAEREGLLAPGAEVVGELREACGGGNASDAAASALAARRAELEKHVEGHAARLAAAVAAVSAEDAAIREVALANYLEVVAQFATGGRREAVYSFLSLCVARPRAARVIR